MSDIIFDNNTEEKTNSTNIKLFDTLTNQECVINEMQSERVQLYVCGPTVYDDAHLGHARTYIMNDVITKTIRQTGANFDAIMNITDVDDKIINRTKELYGTGEKHNELSQKYTQRFLEDMVRLKIELPETIVKVTDNINEIIKYIENLMKGGFAYVELNSVDGKGKSVYFDTEKFKTTHETDYIFEKAKNQGDFDDKHVSSKKKSQDFALWKGVVEDDIGWNSPWGKGRPGWHTECAAFIDMYKDYSDFTRMIHTGGIDLCFPHHENEMKQLATNLCMEEPYFIHIGHLHINGQKMAKSLKNFTTIRDFLSDDDGRKVAQLRYMFLQVHYSEPMDFSSEHFDQAQRQLHLLHNIVQTINVTIDKHLYNTDSYDIKQEIPELPDTSPMTDNFKFNIVLKGLYDYGAIIFKYIEETKNPNITYLKNVKKIYDEIIDMFGLTYDIKNENNDDMVSLITKIRDDVRTQAKATKNKDLWKLSDVIRNNMLKPLGYQLEDKPNEPSVWKKV